MARFRKNGKFNRKINFVRSSKMKYMNKICTEDHVYGKFTDNLQDDHGIIINCELDVGASVTVLNDPSHDDCWKEGRRVVELLHLAENLFCKMCTCPLQLLDTVGERKYGLGSVLYIPCSSCKACNSVETGKRNGKGAFLVNSKAAIGMIHAGIGSTHVNNFLSDLNVPLVNPSTIKKKENEVGKKIHEAAIESCKTVQQQEKNLSNGKIEVSFDGGWQKRGSGWHSDSNTGHTSMIGSITGKVMDFSLRSRVCNVCEYHQQRKEIVPAHDCSKNWYGSSKGMEPDMAVEMTHNLKDSGCQIQVLHADNDSTTTSRMKVDFDDLEKKDDQNHVKKGFSKKLYELSKKFKELKHPDVIPYMVRCFLYAVKENTGSVENIQLALKRMVLHIFGDHTLCENAEWCTYANDPFNFK
ncbi:Hypothetical predicted protein [Mytilus galloprovincialis]|uniref:Mutator-like transposase domain-containing protein n=1 Tax=Mytilus galloprovincialis TaxID=29158 RepID=A0A8B6DP47_MYTGA|nr:Hypothetical predicted protein [Mytilus galloprovincialis]